MKHGYVIFAKVLILGTFRVRTQHLFIFFEKKLGTAKCGSGMRLTLNYVVLACLFFFLSFSFPKTEPYTPSFLSFANRTTDTPPPLPTFLFSPTSHHHPIAPLPVIAQWWWCSPSPNNDDSEEDTHNRCQQPTRGFPLQSLAMAVAQQVASLSCFSLVIVRYLSSST